MNSESNLLKEHGSGSNESVNKIYNTDFGSKNIDTNVMKYSSSNITNKSKCSSRGSVIYDIDTTLKNERSAVVDTLRGNSETIRNVNAFNSGSADGVKETIHIDYQQIDCCKNGKIGDENVDYGGNFDSRQQNQQSSQQQHEKHRSISRVTFETSMKNNHHSSSSPNLDSIRQSVKCTMGNRQQTLENSTKMTNNITKVKSYINNIQEDSLMPSSYNNLKGIPVEISQNEDQ